MGLKPQSDAVVKAQLWILLSDDRYAEGQMAFVCSYFPDQQAIVQYWEGPVDSLFSVPYTDAINPRLGPETGEHNCGSQ